MLFSKKSGQNLMNVIWMTCRGAKRWIWSCTGLGTTLFHFFLIWFLCFAMNPESPGSTFGVISSESIKLIAESINWAHRATSIVTIVLKNMVQPCRCPFIQGWLFWTKEKTRTIFCSKFSELAGIIPKLEELASVLILVSRYHCPSFWHALKKKIYIGSAFVAVCDQSRSR